MTVKMDRHAVKLLKHLAAYPQYFLVVCLIFLAAFTFRLTGITNQFLGKTFDDGQHIRGVLKVNLIYRRGVSESLMGLVSGNEEQFYMGLDQIEASLGYLATRDYFPPDTQQQMVFHIEETIAELEHLNTERVEGDLTVTNLPIEKLSEISSSLYETIGEEDAKLFSRLTENNAALTARFKQYNKLLVFLHMSMFILVILLLFIMVKRNKAELALREVHDELERRVEERTEELEASLRDKNNILREKDVLLGEKDMLLKEVHHRVKNNLQAISGLFDIQEAHLDDDKVLRVFMETQNRILSMAFIHEKLYHLENITSVNFEEYVRTLTSHLVHSFGFPPDSVTIRTDISDIYLNVETAIPCGLITNELVTNSLKYAFPGDGDNRITIGVRQEGSGAYVMTVSDNGVGLSKDFDLGKSRSLGLQLVSSLVEQLRGTIEIESEDGMAIRITFREHHECHAGAL